MTAQDKSLMILFASLCSAILGMALAFRIAMYYI